MALAHLRTSLDALFSSVTPEIGRGHLAEQGYFLPLEEVVRRAQEAWELGATEICVQAGLAPGMDAWHYVKLCKAIKNALPDLHIHGFSPEEGLYGSPLP